MLNLCLEYLGGGGVLVAKRLTLCYADDICLANLSSEGMQRLINIYDMHSKEHVVLYNGGKSYSLSFKPTCSTFNNTLFSARYGVQSILFKMN